MRAFERILRRTGLPLRMSEGFHPKPKLAFPAPLGVGVEGMDEVMEFDLAEWVHLSEIAARLKEQLPEGIELKELTFGSPREAAQAAEAAYEMRPATELQADARLSEERLKDLMARDDIPVRRIRKRKEKTVDIRPFLLALDRENDALTLRVAAGPNGSTRPEEVLAALGFDAETVRTRFETIRTRVILTT